MVAAGAWEVAHIRLPAIDIGIRGGPVFTVSGDTATWFPLVEIFSRDCYRVASFTDIRSWRMVIDVGAHIGAFSLRVASISDDVEIVAFEPSPETFEFLERNVSRNGFATRIRTVRGAVSARAGTSSLSGGEGRSSLRSIVWEDEGEGVDVVVLAFDQVISEISQQIDMLKLDCEGSEYEIILESQSESWSSVRNVLLEFHPRSGRSFEELRGRLRDYGFELAWVDYGIQREEGVALFRRVSSLIR